MEIETDILHKMANYFGNDTKRINHALKVYGFAAMIAGREKLSQAEADTVRIAAILHDIGIHEAERKYGSSSGVYQEMEGPSIAWEILYEFNLDNDMLGRILYLIGNHHSYTEIDGTDFQVLVEADFLVNIYEDGIKKEAITKIKENIFKTKTGIRLLTALYIEKVPFNAFVSEFLESDQPSFAGAANIFSDIMD